MAPPDRRRDRGPVIVLVHGAWHGGWAWSRVAAALNDAGSRTLVVDLPGVGRAPGRADLPGHADALVSAVANTTDEQDRIVLCGHSYGGAVISEAAPRLPAVTDLIYVAAFQLAEGESCRDANPSPTVDADRDPVRSVGDLLYYDAGAARTTFYHDCTDQDADAAAARLTPEHVGTVTTPQAAAGWRTLPSTYLLTLRDRALPVEWQRRMARRSGRVRELDCGHSPMLSVPDVLAAELTAAAGTRC